MNVTPEDVAEQISVSGPLKDDELVKLRTCLHDEETLDDGADPAVHGLYDYYETTKRLVDTVERRRYDMQRIFDSHQNNLDRCLKIIEAGTALVEALNTRDGRGFMHRDAGLEAHWKKLRDELGIETPPPGLVRDRTR